MGDILALRPYANKDAKAPKRKSKGADRLSLWSVRPAMPGKANVPELSDLKDTFRDLAPLWDRRLNRVQAEDVFALKGVASRLASAIEARLAVHYKTAKAAAAEYPSDIAAYFVLREVDEKVCAEVPKLRLRALDFGIKALLAK